MTTTSRVTTCLAAALLIGACSDGNPVGSSASGATPLEIVVPERFPDIPSPQANPLTVEGVALGKRLFFDPILSIDSTISCASCHQPEFAFSDTARFSLGVAGRTGRQSMSLVNLAWAPSLFWDGRAASLEAQVLQPVVDPAEMGETWDNVETKLRRHDDYPELFEAAFPGQTITRDRVAQAIAQFERTLVSGGSRFDAFARGDLEFTAQESLGWRVFGTERGDCFHCHGTDLLTDNRFHNNGLDAVPEDAGRFDVTGEAIDHGRFRTPTLRNVAVTSPYMHDGRFQTLEQVLEHYDGGFHRSAAVDPLLLALPVGRRLSDEERDGLLAFLRTFTDDAFLQEHAR